MHNEKKFLIFAESYRDDSGGIIVLHKLCHLLNCIGYEAYICPRFDSFEINAKNFPRRLFGFLLCEFIRRKSKFSTNKYFKTPLIDGVKIKNIDDYIVVYPEIILGNPLGANNVVRWLLHQPGFHSGKVFYGVKELYFKFNSAIKDFHLHCSTLSNTQLKVIHYPLETYHLPKNEVKRTGTAYCLRKGKDKKIQHDLEDSILIDGKSHSDVANIFRSVKRFISYDTYTAYSIFAVLCGAESVVIPDKGVDIDDWYPNSKDRYGIAYGTSQEQLANADETKHLVSEHIKEEELNSIECVKKFAREAQEFFLPKVNK